MHTCLCQTGRAPTSWQRPRGAPLPVWTVQTPCRRAWKTSILSRQTQLAHSLCLHIIRGSMRGRHAQFAGTYAPGLGSPGPSSPRTLPSTLSAAHMSAWLSRAQELRPQHPEVAPSPSAPWCARPRDTPQVFNRIVTVEIWNKQEGTWCSCEQATSTAPKKWRDGGGLFCCCSAGPKVVASKAIKLLQHNWGRRL